MKYHSTTLAAIFRNHVVRTTLVAHSSSEARFALALSSISVAGVTYCTCSIAAAFFAWTARDIWVTVVTRRASMTERNVETKLGNSVIFHSLMQSHTSHNEFLCNLLDIYHTHTDPPFPADTKDWNCSLVQEGGKRTCGKWVRQNQMSNNIHVHICHSGHQ